MSLANRPIIWNKLQFLVANYSKYLDSSFKIQGSEKTCSIQPLWIQDSNLRLRKTSSTPPVWFKVQDSRLRKNFFNPTSLDSRFKASKKKSSLPPVWIQDSKFKAEGFRFKKFFGILNLESYPLGFKKSFWDLESWILPPWVQEGLFGIMNLESWILPPWVQEVFWGSWILNLGSDVLREGWDGNKVAKNAIFDHKKMP